LGPKAPSYSTNGAISTADHALHQLIVHVRSAAEPADIDVSEERYLAEDARRATSQLRRQDVDAFAFGICDGPFFQLDRVFGERRTLRVARIDVLAQRVVRLYTELKK